MDIDEVTIDPSANWNPVEKPKDIKDEDCKLLFLHENKVYVIDE